MSSSDDLYGVLEVPKGSSVDDVRKAYLKLSKKHHPDKGGSDEHFKAIQRAYSILGDEQKKQMYDTMGIIDGEGGQEMGGGGPFGGGFPFDIGSLFGMFGAAGPNGGMPNGPRVRRAKAPPKIHEIPLSLHDFYHGRAFSINFERQKFCEGCKGQGCMNFTSCDRCHGRGMVEQVVMMGPGMQMMSRGPCNACSGEGRKPGTPCSVCNGKKFMNQEKTLNIRIEPGMKPGETLVFPKECSDNHEYLEAGDVHIVLQEADESLSLKREGDHLHTNVYLTLAESLLGKKITVTDHPGFPKGLEVNIPPGFTNGNVYHLDEKGMPKKGTNSFGKLQVHIHVQVSEDEKSKLQNSSMILKSIFSL
jgi:DnaJ family protein A protein 2